MQRRPSVISQGRRPSNTTEAEFFDLAAAHGFLLTKRGWPDFFLELNGNIAVVEVKTASSREFHPEKRRVLAALCAAGIPCYAWSPDGGLVALAVDGERGTIGGVRLRETESVGTLDEQLASLVELLQTRRGCGGNESDPFGEGAAGDDPPEPAPEAAPPLPSRSETAQMIDRVWTAYVELMKPRRTAAGEEERVIIRTALRACDPETAVEELVTCIRTCAESDYHMKRAQHSTRKGQKYNSIGKILKPRPRLGETQRSRIDWWLDRAKSTGVAGFPSADPAIVGQRQLEVQRGHGSDNSETVGKAKVAEGWLKDHGIETIRAGDGLPTFRRMGSGREG